MMKAAFVCENAQMIHRVYGEAQKAALFRRVEMLPGVFRSLQDDALRDVDVIFSTWGMPVCTEQEIRQWTPNLKMVFYAAGTVQSFARPFLHEHVRVFSAWRANAVPVAQYTFAQIILALKGYFAVQPLTRTCRSKAQAVFQHYPGCFDVKVGLLGCGAIGSLVAEMLGRLDVEVLVFDPFLSEEKAKALGVRKAEMAEIFATCSVVSNHLANLPETVGIIRREYFLSMPSYSVFINTGRGPQLREKDVYDMLTADNTRFALLDVMTEEQNSDANPLNALPNCLITPHIAGSSGLEVRRMAEYAIAALDCALDGRPCEHEVTEAMLKTMA